MDTIGSALAAVGFLALIAAFLLAPIAMIVGLFWAARSRLLGRHTRFDGLFSGMARANQARSELAAGVPPEPMPDTPSRRRRHRSRRRA